MINTRCWVVQRVVGYRCDISGVYSTYALAKEATNGFLDQDFRYIGLMGQGVSGPANLFRSWITNDMAVLGNEADPVTEMIVYQIIEKEVDA